MSQTKYDIFISYSRKDTAIADKICAALDKEGITYFIDRAGIGGGMEFPEVLAENITASTLFLFLASKNSYESKFTNSEITFAFNEKPKNSILPYIIDGSQMPKAMRFIFSGITWRTINEHPIESVLVEDLLNLLGRKRIVETPQAVKKVNPINNDNKKHKSYFVIITIAAIITGTLGYLVVTRILNNNVIIKERAIPDDNYIAATEENTMVDIISQTSISNQESDSKHVVTTKNKIKEEKLVEKTSPASLQNSYSQKQISESNNPTTPSSKSDVNNIIDVIDSQNKTNYDSNPKTIKEDIDSLAYLLSIPDDEFIRYKDEKGKWGYKLKTSNKIVIPAKYDFICQTDFHEGLAYVKLGGRYGFINKTGEEVIQLKYEGSDVFNNGYAWVKLDGKWGFIDKNGKEITRFKYDHAFYFMSNGLCRVNLNGKYGYIDTTGKEIISIKYDEASSYFNKYGLADVKLNGKYGFIDRTGKEVIPIKYNYVGVFTEGIVHVRMNGKYGFIDKTGRIITPLKYDYADYFSEGLAGVGLDGKYGFIDKTGKEVIPLIYSDIIRFYKGKAEVRLKRKVFYIDKNGNRIE